jgi:hypothetical protein
MTCWCPTYVHESIAENQQIVLFESLDESLRILSANSILPDSQVQFSSTKVAEENDITIWRNTFSVRYLVRLMRGNLSGLFPARSTT